MAFYLSTLRRTHIRNLIIYLNNTRFEKNLLPDPIPYSCTFFL